MVDETLYLRLLSCITDHRVHLPTSAKRKLRAVCALSDLDLGVKVGFPDRLFDFIQDNLVRRKLCEITTRRIRELRAEAA